MDQQAMLPCFRTVHFTDPVKFLCRRFRVKSLIFCALLLLYVVLSFCVFVGWVGPSLDGHSTEHIAADSSTYLYFADQIRGGQPDPFVIAALASFPNNLWAPVLLALLLKSTFVMVLANYAFLILTVVLFKRTFEFSIRVFLSLLLLNATTVISLLSVNKEIIDLLVVAIFFYGHRRHRRAIIFLALAISAVNRFELCMVMISFLIFTIDARTIRRHRGLALLLLVLALDLVVPVFIFKLFPNRMDEASSGGLVIWLNSLEMHYLYVLAMIPKVAQNLLGTIANPSSWQSLLNPSDIANSYIVFLNNLATFVVLLVLGRKKRAFSLDSDPVFFAIIGCIFMGVTPVIQPRYFYFVYALLCLRASEVPDKAGMLKNRAPLVLANG